MITMGFFVRCPIDREHPRDPRLFATGKVIYVNEFNETAHIIFDDPFGYRKFFEYVPKAVEEAPLVLMMAGKGCIDKIHLAMTLF